MSIYTTVRDFLQTRGGDASFGEIRQGTGLDCSDTQRALRYLRYRGDVVATGPFRKMLDQFHATPDPAARLAAQEADNAKKRAKRKAARDRRIAAGTYLPPGKYHRKKLESTKSGPIVVDRNAPAETVEQWMARTGQRPEVLPMGAASGNLIDLELA